MMRAHGKTHPGLRRENNEDAFAICPHLHAAILDDDVISVGLFGVSHAREDSPSLRPFRINPGSQRELVVESEGRHIAGIDEALPVELAGQANLARFLRCLAVFPMRGRCFARGIARHVFDREMGDFRRQQFVLLLLHHSSRDGHDLDSGREHQLC